MTAVPLEHPSPGVLRPVLPYASVLLAENPGSMTLDGTNTWIVRAPGARECLVIDPGPDDARHLAAIADHAPVGCVLVTHHHPDHTAGIGGLSQRTGAPVRAVDPGLCLPGTDRAAAPLTDGEVLDEAGIRLRVVATPGHTSDSVCLLAEHEGVGALFSGDTILGKGTTIIAEPDGDLGSYLDSLHRLAELDQETAVLPGHGPELPDARAAAEAYLDHRKQRLDQVRSAAREMVDPVTARGIVEIVYADVDRSVRPAAESTVRAQLDYLRYLGEL